MGRGVPQRAKRPRAGLGPQPVPPGPGCVGTGQRRDAYDGQWQRAGGWLLHGGCCMAGSGAATAGPCAAHPSPRNPSHPPPAHPTTPQALAFSCWSSPRWAGACPCERIWACRPSWSCCGCTWGWGPTAAARQDQLLAGGEYLSPEAQREFFQPVVDFGLLLLAMY